MQLDPDNISVYDEENKCFGGYLHKKAGSKKGGFRLGKGWSKRYFIIEDTVGGDDNFTLDYYHKPRESHPRERIPLLGAEVIFEGPALGRKEYPYEFHLKLRDRANPYVLAADTEEQFEEWIESLQHVIEVANFRDERMQVTGDHAFADLTPRPSRSKRSMPDTSVSNTSPTTHMPGTRGAVSPPGEDVEDAEGLEYAEKEFRGVGTDERYPSVRIEVDIHSIPPGSTARKELYDGFCRDISRIMNVSLDMVEVIRVRKAIQSDWMSVLEFFVDFDEMGLGEAEEDEFYEQLEGMIMDPSSALYTGEVTQKIDPSFRNVVIEDVTNPVDLYLSLLPSIEENPVALVIDKYRDEEIPEHAVDMSSMQIYVQFEGITKPLQVPNPRLLRPRDCMLWPHEIKRALNIEGSIQDMWLEPIALTPLGLPLSLSASIPFHESARHNRLMAIDVRSLKAGLTYNVEFDDRRMLIRDMLSPEERNAIENTFLEYDANGDGTIDKEECMELVRIRSDARKEAVDTQYDQFIAENGTSEDVVEEADQIRLEQYQKIDEAQDRMLAMYEHADLDGNGVLTIEEFTLAEAWWMKCSIDPQRVNVF